MPKKVKITPEVREVLERGEWAGWLFRLPPEKLDRPLYEAVNKVLVALGGKWHRGHQGHMFSLDAKPALVAALQSGVAVDRMRTAEQFFTPTDVADKMIERLAPKQDWQVLEPSAGSGRLVARALAAGCIVTAVEQDERLMADLLEVFDRHPGRGQRVCADFLALDWATPRFDGVLMNPPFSRGQDMAHVRRAFELLLPGGVLVAVMSPHWVQSTDRASNDFRVLLSRLGDDAYDWDPLPDRSFSTAGTTVSTGILTITKGASE